MLVFMLNSLPRRAARAALIISAAAAITAPAQAQYGGQAAPAAESPQEALARNVRLVAANPRNFQALVAAGRAALATGDTQAAVGFYGRAEELSPGSWQPQAGMGAVMVAMGEPRGSFPYFSRALQLGATQMHIALDRGLAFDLIGDQANAQADYRVALLGAEADEARRRLALSLAISRDIKGAAAMIEPLLVRRDSEALRLNAFVLALAGDREGARRTIDAAMPGAGMRFEPFFKVLPVLRPEEKAAAVHMGIFPADAAQRYAQAEPIPSSPVVSIGNSSRPRQQVNTSNSRARPKQPPKLAEAPRRAVQQAAQPSTYMAMVRPSLDPSRYASTRRPRTKEAGDAKARAAEPDPDPRPEGRLDDIARMLSSPAGDQADGGQLVQVAEAQPAEPAFVFADNASQVSRPKVETQPPIVSRPKVESGPAPASKPKIDPKAAKLAAEKKAKAEADRKAREEAARLGVAGANWVQLAGGANQDRMGAEYRRLAAKAGSLLKSRSGYVTQGKDYFRLLVGPFATADEAQDFVTKLAKAGVDSFRWTRNPAQIRIEKLKS